MSQVATPGITESAGTEAEREMADNGRGLFGGDFAVVIMDSDYTTFDEVERACIALFGYSRDEACGLLARDPSLIASFSRALLEGLGQDQTDDEFNATLDASITRIYDASVRKVPVA